jgi:hypothetical protein
MDFLAYEHDRAFVLDALRRGEVDYVEPIAQAAEADLFRQLVGRDVLHRLAETYPSPRKKEEVPIWIYLASQLTLKLHGAAYHALPYVLRSGGLITALGPEVGRPARHAETQAVSLACPGFNDKNHYARETPCDQDFVRKFARATDVDRLLAWFNREVPRCLRALKLFDPEGLFVGDASYVFVPNNPHYEKSVMLLFDQHNHPVDPKTVDLSTGRYQWRRCYKIVTLLHIPRTLDFFLTVAAHVMPGNEHECPVLYRLVDDFVKAVDRGRMKVLLVDRGLIDGAQMARLKREHNIDTIVPLPGCVGLSFSARFPLATVFGSAAPSAHSPARLGPGPSGKETPTNAGGEKAQPDRGRRCSGGLLGYSPPRPASDPHRPGPRFNHLDGVHCALAGRAQPRDRPSRRNPRLGSSHDLLHYERARHSFRLCPAPHH